MKIPVIELSDCIFCGVCEEVAPDVFNLGEGKYILITEMEIYPEAEVNEAIKNCPKQCIYWEDEK